jgi:hypothetical protein
VGARLYNRGYPDQPVIEQAQLTRPPLAIRSIATLLFPPNFSANLTPDLDARFEASGIWNFLGEEGADGNLVMGRLGSMVRNQWDCSNEVDQPFCSI